MIIKKIPLPLVVIKDDAVTLSGVQGARLVDCYPDGRGNIRKRPGLDIWADLGVTTRIDGLYWWNKKGVLLAVSGGNLWKFTTTDGVGSDISGSEKLGKNVLCSFANDDTYTIIANSGKMLKYDNSATPDYLDTDVDAPTDVTHVGYLNTRILAKKADSALVAYSDVSDAVVWGATSAFQPESKPDDLMGMYIVGNEIVLPGELTTEVWYDTGNSAVPFRVMKAATLPIGMIAAHSFQNAEGSLIWLDDKRRFIRVDGRRPREISQFINYELRDITPVSDAVSMFINYGDDAFYICNFPTGNKTYVYDVKRDVFVEWGMWNLKTGDWDEFICNTHAFSPTWDKHLLGSSNTGKIYLLNENTYQDDGNPIRSLIQTAPNDHGILEPKFCSKVTLKLKRSAGDSTGTEPKFQMRYRDDGSGAWSNWRNGSLGKLGDYGFFITFSQLGRYISRQWEFAHAENSDFILAEAEETLELTASL